MIHNNYNRYIRKGEMSISYKISQMPSQTVSVPVQIASEASVWSDFRGWERKGPSGICTEWQGEVLAEQRILSNLDKPGQF